MKILLMLLLLVPQLATARVYMCVNPETGQTSFTDKACEKKGTGEEVRVDPTNLDSGSRSKKGGPAKTWNSERDTRKTGNDYSAQRRDLYEKNPTASTN